MLGENKKVERSRKKARIISFIPDGEYYYQKGITAYQKGDLYRAKKFVERAINFNPSEPEYLCQEAAILAELERYEESNELLRKVVSEIDQTMTECYFFMANNYAYLGRFEEAIRVLKKYFSLDPHGSFIQEARELYRMLSLESQSALYEEEGFIADHERARKALEKCQYQKAIDLFKKVIQEQPTFWVAYNNLSVAYFSMGRLTEAFSTLQQVIASDPGNIPAICNLVTFYLQLDDREQVAEWTPVLDKLYPFFPEHRSKLGATYFFLGEYEKAYRWLRSAARSCTHWDQPFYFWYAMTAYNLGRMNEAKRMWEKVDFFSEMPFDPLDYGQVVDLFKAGEGLANPFVSSIIDHELKRGGSAAKICTLFYLKAACGEGGREKLAAFSQDMRNDKTMRIIAETLLHHENDPRLLIMKELEAKWGGGLPLVEHYQVYDWWSILFQHMGQASLSPEEIQAWAASLTYLLNKDLDIKTSQKAVAQQHGISVYRLRKCLEKWKIFVQQYVGKSLKSRG